MNYRRPTQTPARNDADSEVSHGPEHRVTLAHGDRATSTLHSHVLTAPETNGTDAVITAESKGADTASALERNVKFVPSKLHPNGIVTLSTFRPRDNVIQSTAVSNYQSVTPSSSQSKGDGKLTASQTNGAVTPAISCALAPSVSAAVTRQVFE